MINRAWQIEINKYTPEHVGSISNSPLLLLSESPHAIIALPYNVYPESHETVHVCPKVKVVPVQSVLPWGIIGEVHVITLKQ